MMAHKALIFKDVEIYNKILGVHNPGKIKALGREIRGFVQELWDEASFDIVVKGNTAKFSQNKELKEFLLSTGDKVLVEASPTDHMWGIGLGKDDPWAQNPLKWQGKNMLGFALMAAREIIKQKEGKKS